MTINTAGYLKSKITSDAIIEVLNKNLGKEVLQNSVIFNPLTKGETGYIYFMDNQAVKSLFFCVLQNTLIFDELECSCISMEKDKDSLDLITRIVEQFGGYVEENDCNGKGPFRVDKKGKPLELVG